MNQDELKKSVAKAAIDYIKPKLESDTIIGIGTGSTANYFIDELASLRHDFEAAVSSSESSTDRLKKLGIQVYDLNSVSNFDMYIDGADEINDRLEMVKGGGGALTREKIVAAVAREFICIADETKLVPLLGDFPLPVEVIPMARSYVGREIVKLGGDPVYREGFVTDNGNIILDVYNFKISSPLEVERQLNNITGVVTNGLFALRPADVLFLGTENGVKTIKP